MYIADWVHLNNTTGGRQIEATAFTWTAEIEATPSLSSTGAILFRRRDGESDRYEQRKFAWYHLLKETLEDGDYGRFERYYRAVSAEWEGGSNDYRFATERLANTINQIDTSASVRTVPRVLALLAAKTSGLMYDEPPAVVVGGILVYHLVFAEQVSQNDAIETVNDSLPSKQTVDNVADDITEVLDTTEIEAVITPESKVTT